MQKLITLAVIIWQTMNVSAYTWSGNKTASGVYPQVGMCAADHLPFGAKVTLPNGTVLTVMDRFGGGYSDRLDIFMASEAECWQFGRQFLRCKVEIE